jgi:hypothetical protein
MSPTSATTPSSRPSRPPSLRACLHAILSACLAVVQVGCGDDDGPAPSTVDSSAPSTTLDGSTPPIGSVDAGIAVPPNALPGPDGALPPQAPPPTQYIIATGVTVGEMTTSYIKSVTDIDTPSKLDLKNTLEAPGFGDIHVIGDKMWVSNGDTPEIARYVIGKDGSFSKDATINFGSYSDSAAIYEQAFASATKAILNGDDAWVVWNPTTMKIDATIPYPASIGVRDGREPFYAYDRGFIARGNRVYQTVNWVDYTNYTMPDTSTIVVLDTDANKVLSILEAPCPGLDLLTVDDKGDIYSSGWVWGPGATLVNGAPKGCIVKIPAGGDALDPSFKLGFSEFTGGHEGAALRHISGSKFLLSVFREDKAPYNPATQKISEWTETDSWRYATYDMATKEYRELDTLPWFSGGYYSAKIADRFYLLSPGVNYEATSYQQLLPDGTAKNAISMEGWSTRVFAVQ